MEVVEKNPDLKKYELRTEPELHLSGLEIYPDRRKIYWNGQEARLTVKGGSLTTQDIIFDGGAVLDDDFNNSGKVWNSPLIYAPAGIITLATCDRRVHGKNGRFLVMAGK